MNDYEAIPMIRYERPSFIIFPFQSLKFLLWSLVFLMLRQILNYKRVTEKRKLESCYHWHCFLLRSGQV